MIDLVLFDYIFVRSLCLITSIAPLVASPQQGGLNAEAWAEGQGYAGQGCPGKPEAVEDEQDRGGRHIAAFPQYRCGGFDRAGGQVKTIAHRLQQAGSARMQGPGADGGPIEPLGC